MDIIFSVIPEQLFWRILLFIHFLIAVTLLAGITLQAVTVLMPARQVAGNFIERGPLPAASYAAIIAPLYVIQVLLGAFIYLKYRLYVRIPLEELRHWWTVGGFEFKEHIIAMGFGLLPAYWYFWQQPQSTEYAVVIREQPDGRRSDHAGDQEEHAPELPEFLRRAGYRRRTGIPRLV